MNIYSYIFENIYLLIFMYRKVYKNKFKTYKERGIRGYRASKSLIIKEHREATFVLLQAPLIQLYIYEYKKLFARMNL